MPNFFTAIAVVPKHVAVREFGVDIPIMEVLRFYLSLVEHVN